MDHRREFSSPAWAWKPLEILTSAHMRGISAQMLRWPRCDWTATALTVLLAELLMVPLLPAATFFVQSRKTDFL